MPKGAGFFDIYLEILKIQELTESKILILTSPPQGTTLGEIHS